MKNYITKLSKLLPDHSDKIIQIIKSAGILQDLIEQYPQHEEALTKASTLPYIKTNHLKWIALQLEKKEPFVEIVGTIKKMIDFKQKMNTDVYKYETLGELREAIESIGNSASQKKEKDKEVISADIVYKDSEYLVVQPKNKEASIYYGKGSRWCTAATVSRNYFNNYAGKGIFFYYIIKSGGENKPTDKIAFALSKDLKNQEGYIVKGYIPELECVAEIFNAHDVQMNIFGVKIALGDKFAAIINAIKQNLKKYEKNEYKTKVEKITPEQIKEGTFDKETIMQIVKNTKNPDILKAIYYYKFDLLDSDWDNNSLERLAQNENLPLEIFTDALSKFETDPETNRYKLVFEIINNYSNETEILDLVSQYPLVIDQLINRSQIDLNFSGDMLDLILNTILEKFKYLPDSLPDVFDNLIENIAKNPNIKSETMKKIMKIDRREIFDYELEKYINLDNDFIRDIAYKEFKSKTDKIKLISSQSTQETLQYYYIYYMHNIVNLVKNIIQKINHNIEINSNIGTLEYLYDLSRKFKEINSKYTMPSAEYKTWVKFFETDKYLNFDEIITELKYLIDSLKQLN